MRSEKEIKKCVRGLERKTRYTDISDCRKINAVLNDDSDKLYKFIPDAKYLCFFTCQFIKHFAGDHQNGFWTLES